MKWGGSGGTALSAIGTVLSVDAFGKLGAFQLTPPAASTTTLFTQFAGTADEAAQGCASYTGVDQGTPNGTAVTNTGSIAATSGTATSGTVTTNVGDLVLAALFLYDNDFQGPTSAPTGSPTPTERYQATIGGDQVMAIQEAVATGSSTTVSFAISGGGGALDAKWGIIAFVVNAAGDGDVLSAQACL